MTTNNPLIKKIDKLQRPTGIKLNKKDFASIKEYQKEYDKQYSLLKKQRRKDIYKLNSEYKCNQQKEWAKNNPEKVKKINEKQMNDYYNHPTKRKGALTRGWSKSGMIFFDDTFDKFIKTTNCESCGCDLIMGKGKGKNKKTLDHDHFSGMVRHVICHSCNIWRRGYDNRRMKLHLELYRYHYRK